MIQPDKILSIIHIVSSMPGDNRCLAIRDNTRLPPVLDNTEVLCPLITWSFLHISEVLSIQIINTESCIDKHSLLTCIMH